MRIFVAGGGGYIGLPVCHELARRGHLVTAFDRWFFRKEPPVECLKMCGDVRDIGRFGDGTDAIIDLAGLSNDAVGDINPELTYEINVKGAQRLALAAKRGGVKRYIYSSSAAVYGNNPKFGLTETDDCKPLTAYAESKVRMEDFLRAEASEFFKPVILRNATVFGVAPRMRYDLVVNAMTRSAYVDGAIMIDGDGNQWRPFVHIQDVVDEFCNALDADESLTRNIVSCNRQIKNVAGRVVEPFSDEILIEKRETAVDQRSYHLKETVTNGKTISDGVRGIIAAFETGILDPDDPTGWTVKWYREHCQL